MQSLFAGNCSTLVAPHRPFALGSDLNFNVKIVNRPSCMHYQNPRFDLIFPITLSRTTREHNHAYRATASPFTLLDLRSHTNHTLCLVRSKTTFNNQRKKLTQKENSKNNKRECATRSIHSELVKSVARMRRPNASTASIWSVRDWKINE